MAIRRRRIRGRPLALSATACVQSLECAAEYASRPTPGGIRPLTDQSDRALSRQTQRHWKQSERLSEELLAPRICFDPARTPQGQQRKQRPHLLLNVAIIIGSGV